MICDLIFPTGIWHDYLEINHDDIIEFCREKRYSSNGRILSNIGGWQSEDFWPEEDPRIHELSREIYARSLTILDQFKFDTSNTDLRFLNMWININYQNCLNNIHIHHGSILSGVYYLKCPKNCGDISFHRNFSETFILKTAANLLEDNTFNYTNIRFAVEEKKLLLFPSWLPHSVEPNQSEEERISIAFNMVLLKK
jgi:uncharacterized protein (TIGR02466 family)